MSKRSGRPIRSQNAHGGLRWPFVMMGIVAVGILVVSTLELPVFDQQLSNRLPFVVAGIVFAMALLIWLLKRGGVDEHNWRRALSAVLVVHVIATCYFLPIGDMVNDRPVLTLDHSFHYYQAYRADEFFWKTLRVDQFDPYFMAGYPGGTIFDLDMKGAEMFCVFTPLVGTARALKLFILLAYVSMALTLFWGSRMQGFRMEESFMGLLVFLAYWHWGRPYAGDFRYAGMFSFVFASHLSFLLVGLIRRFAQKTWIKTFFLIGPAAFLVHPTAVVMLPVPFAAAIAVDRRLWGPKKWLALLVWCAGVVFINYIWLEPFFKYLWIKTTTEAYYQIEGWRGLARVVLKPSCLIAICLVALSFVGVRRMAVEKRLSNGMPALLGAVFLFVIAGAGVNLRLLSQLEPGRFLFSGFVFLAPLAGVGTRSVCNLLFAQIPAERGKYLLRASALAALILVVLPLSLLESKSYNKHTVRTSYPPRVRPLIEVIKNTCDSSGRLMIEDGPASAYGDIHLPGVLPLLTGVEQIGGPYPHTFLLYHFASFQWEKTFGKPMNEWTLQTFKPYLDLYNIRWIVTSSRESGTFMRNLLGVKPEWADTRYALWSLSDRTGFTGEVNAGINRITVENGPSEGYLLNYHWVPGITALPPADIRPTHQLDDPVPFIFVSPNGATVVEILY